MTTRSAFVVDYSQICEYNYTMHSHNCESSSGVETPTQRLASILLGHDVRSFIRDRRTSGRAWRFIARDLYDATDGQIDVTYETLRGWHDGAAA